MTIPDSVLKLSTNLPPFKIVPVELPLPPWPVGIMLLKNRTIEPAAQPSWTLSQICVVAELPALSVGGVI